MPINFYQKTNKSIIKYNTNINKSNAKIFIIKINNCNKKANMIRIIEEEHIIFQIGKKNKKLLIYVEIKNQILH